MVGEEADRMVAVEEGQRPVKWPAVSLRQSSWSVSRARRVHVFAKHRAVVHCLLRKSYTVSMGERL